MKTEFNIGSAYVALKHANVFSFATSGRTAWIEPEDVITCFDIINASLSTRHLNLYKYYFLFGAGKIYTLQNPFYMTWVPDFFKRLT